MKTQKKDIRVIDENGTHYEKADPVADKEVITYKFEIYKDKISSAIKIIFIIQI